MERTQGEWRVTDTHLPDKQALISENYLIALIEWGGCCPDHRRVADAQLIASAPDLYEKGKQALLWIASTMHDFHLESDGTYEELFDALAKAEGK